MAAERSWWLHWMALSLVGLTSSCRAPESGARRPIRYEVGIDEHSPLRLQVQVEADWEPGTSLSLGVESAHDFVEFGGSGNDTSAPWAWPAAGTATFTVALEEMARRLRTHESARRHGDCVIAPLFAWLPRPRMLAADQPVEIELAEADTGWFVSALGDPRDGLMVRGRQLRQRCFAVVGPSTAAELAIPRRGDRTGREPRPSHRLLAGARARSDSRGAAAMDRWSVPAQRFIVGRPYRCSECCWPSSPPLVVVASSSVACTRARCRR